MDPRAGLRIAPLWAALAAALPAQYDLVVYGGTPAGVAAAVQAAREGRTAVLIEPTAHVGGMTVSGLGATDIGNKAAIGGVAREFYRRVRAHYLDDAAWTAERRADFRGRGHRPDDDAAWTFEPRVAEAILGGMLAEAGVEVVRGERLDLRRGVVVADGRIAALHTVGGRRFQGRVFVDASYEGDVLAGAGVTYRVGREANAEFGETLDGVQARHAEYHQFVVPVDPYAIPGDRRSGLVPGVAAHGPGREGDRDGRVQAYCFRLCATDDPSNRVPWPRPAGYDERDYELLLRNFEAGDHRLPWHPVWMPNRKTDSNNNHAFSTDYLGANHGYPDAGWERRDAIVAEHRRYQQGLMWTLANHPRVPEEVRAHFSGFGLAADEFTDNGHWPYQLYVREARRMVGELVMTEHHCRGTAVVADPVGLGAYGMDSHNVQRYVDADGHVRNEGDVQVHGFSPYGISYRAIVPRRAECRNLLVPVCLSATHIAFGSIRMEPVFFVLGQSAAVAAGVALDAGGETAIAVQDVGYPALRERLLALEQVLEWTGPVRRLIGLDPAGLLGAVADDAGAELVGRWIRSSSVTPFVGVGYAHDGGAAEEGTRAQFALRAPAAGRYEVRFAYTAHPNRAAALPVAVSVGGGPPVERVVDQRTPPPLDGLWTALAELELAAGERVVVIVDCAGTTGVAVVDAVWLRPLDG